MDFSYQSYVNRFKYKPFEWPPDISLAELHSRCSQPGPANPKGVKCPCCGFPTKQRMEGWLMRDIYDDFKEWGSGIPAYFGLLRFYNVIAFTVLLINAIYPVFVTYLVCNHFNKDDICVQIGVLRYLAFSQMADALRSHNEDDILATIMILQTVVFYILLIANNASIFYLLWVNRRCKKKVESEEKYLTLLVENLPSDTTEESLMKALDVPSDAVKSITFIKEIKHFSEIYRKRVLAYYELKALYVEGIEPKKQKQMNDTLRKLEKEYLTLRELKRMKNQKAVVVFTSRDVMLNIKSKFSLNELYHWQYGFLAFFKKKVNEKVFTSHMPDLQQTIWANIGENHTHKMMSKIRTFVVCVVLIAFCYALFYYPLKFSLASHSTIDTSAKLTLTQKFLPGIIALVMMAMSILFRMYMQVLAQRRHPKTYLEYSKFVLATTVMFHLIFYLIVPTIFFVVPNGINQSVKLYALSQQAQTFIIIQMILSCIDFVFRMWKMKKIKALSDQREAFKYPQQYLNERVEYREFPLELKLIIMFKIWSFALFYAFFQPYITFLISLSLLLLYLLEKRNLYCHYSQRRYLGVELQIKFLNIYINFFCIYECLIYSLNVDSKWQIYAAVASTALSLLLQIVYWQVIQGKLQKRKEKLLKKAHLLEQAKKKQEEENSKLNDSLNQPIIDDDRFSKEDDDEKLELQDIKKAEKTYAEAYKEYLMSFYHPELDEEIKTYLGMLDSYDAGTLRVNSLPADEQDSTSRDIPSQRKESNIEMFSKHLD